MYAFLHADNFLLAANVLLAVQRADSSGPARAVLLGNSALDPSANEISSKAAAAQPSGESYKFFRKRHYCCQVSHVILTQKKPTSSRRHSCYHLL